MKRFVQQFNKGAQKISLSTREQEELLGRIEAYMEYHPLPKDRQQTDFISPLQITEPVRFIRIPRRFFAALTTVTAMFLFVVVPAMAEQSMPGNMLHPIKIHVNEEIRGLFLSGEERVAWETNRVERRLAEARRLAVLGRLTPEIEARVAESVMRQKNTARNQITSLETTDADAATMATMAMASMLEVQETLLDSVRSGSEEAVSELSQVIESSREESKEKTETAVVSEAKLLAMIEQHATRAYEILLGLEKKVEATEKENIIRRLSDFERTLSEYTSDVVLTEEEKIVGLRAVWGDLQKLISYMNSLRDSSSIDVERVVPMRLTYDERVQKLRDEQAILTERQQKLITLSENHPTAESLEKIRFSTPLMVENLALVQTVNPGNIKTVENAVQEVRHQIESLEKSIPAELWRSASTTEETTIDDSGQSDEDNSVDETIIED